jgi:hypothetical protein
MPSRRTVPPFEFLEKASKQSLASYELSRLNHASNLREEIAELLDAWLDEQSAALLARWLLERHRVANSQRAKTIADTTTAFQVLQPIPPPRRLT